jgi:hypothetical protein
MAAVGLGVTGVAACGEEASPPPPRRAASAGSPRPRCAASRTARPGSAPVLDPRPSPPRWGRRGAWSGSRESRGAAAGVAEAPGARAGSWPPRPEAVGGPRDGRGRSTRGGAGGGGPAGARAPRGRGGPADDRARATDPRGGDAGRPARPALDSTGMHVRRRRCTGSCGPSGWADSTAWGTAVGARRLVNLSPRSLDNTVPEVSGPYPRQGLTNRCSRLPTASTPPSLPLPAAAERRR